ncbi:GAF domain-containing sensor histidine kinase [Desulfosporosinus sp. SYSU MS00001]|uniref:GAF domain-containing sensor histidine kinase n=1 Tax=Desulfosporosinus sp. SYSU MS00001 TaxID=3416284 RepID=UPI003CEF4AB3
MINIPIPSVVQNTISETPFTILGVVFWLLGFATWLRRPFLVEARKLFWFNWSTGLAIVLASASSRDLLFARELEYIIFATVPINLNDFISIFLKDNNKQINRWGRLILKLMFALILLITVLQSANITSSFSSLRKLVLAIMTIGSLFALWNLSSLLSLPKDKPQKNQANILLIGMVVGFLPFVLLTAIPTILGLQPIMNSHFSSLFVSMIPAISYYAVVNKYLPDSRRLIGIIIPFVVPAVILCIVISYLLFALKESEKFSLKPYLWTPVLFIIVILGFDGLRFLTTKLLDKIIFKNNKHSFKNRILKLNEQLSILNEENQIMEEMIRRLAIEGVFIIAENGKGEYLKRASGRFLKAPDEQIALEEFVQREPETSSDSKILPDDYSAEIYIPVISDDYTFAIFLGHRKSHVKFEPDELPLIELVSSQMAHRLKTMLVIRELSKEIKDLAQRSLEEQRKTQGLQGINISLFRNLEKERKLIASEIHDGPLQLGLDVNRWLNYLVEECHCSENTKANKAICHIRDLVENLNFELRLICNDLRPPSLTDLGLVPAIELLCEEIMHNELLLISLETEGMNREERYEEEVELAAFRFVQEGITNAIKHSGSRKLEVQIKMKESRLELTVSDSGKGFDTSKIEDWLLTSVHFGIVGMKERLENLGGELQINSMIGQGTFLKAVIPIV